MTRFVFCTCLLAALALSGCSSSREKSPQANETVSEQRRRAAGFMQARQYPEAVAVLDSLTRARPSDSDLFEMLGDAHRGAGNTDAAITGYEQALRLNYGAFAPHMKLGTILMENGKTGRAMTEFELAVKANDRDALARYNYGIALHELGRHDEARAQWQVASEIDPTDSRMSEALGMGYSGVNDSIAIAQFERARVLGADNAAYHNNYALVLDRLGHTAEAETHYEAALAKAPDDKRDEYRRNFALHQMRMSRYEDARNIFVELVGASTGLWSDTVYLSRAYLELKQFDDAIAVLEPFALDVESGKIPRSSKRIDRMPPTLDEALDILGMSWRGKGDKQRAVEYLKRAVALRPDDTAHLNNYGVALAEGGMLPDAQAQWRKVLEIDPDNATARANLSAFGR